MIDFSAAADSGIPLGTQLIWKLKGMVARGALRSGDRMPSVRELASFAGVNVNTVRAAYEALENEGVIGSSPGRGTYVTAHPVEPHVIDALTRDTLRKAQESDIDPKEFAATLWAAAVAEDRQALPDAPLPQLDPGLGAAMLRRELRSQIARIESELSAYTRYEQPTVAPRLVESARPVGRMTSVEELVQIRDGLIDRLSRHRGEADRRGARQEQNRARVEEMFNDPEAHKWEIVTSEQLGDPSCKHWRVVPRFGPFGAIAGWWRVKVSSGCPLSGPLAADVKRSDRNRK
jgi:DNA-binding transcriptional regulator YhcF (GntR family)